MMGYYTNYGDAPYYYPAHMSGFTGFGIFGGVMMLVWWLIIIAAIVGLAKWFLKDLPRQRSSSALDILRERYAKGEINSEEFEERKKTLIK